MATPVAHSLVIVSTFVIAVLAITFIVNPGIHASIDWDLANFAGFTTFALWLYLFLDTGKQGNQRFHEVVAYLSVVLLIIHALWFVATDATIWHYLSLDMPYHMMAAILALILAIVVPISAAPTLRRYWHQSSHTPTFKFFSQWHNVMTLGMLCLALWHMLESGLYLQKIEAIVLALTCLLLILYRQRVKLKKAHALSLWLIPIWPCLAVAILHST